MDKKQPRNVEQNENHRSFSSGCHKTRRGIDTNSNCGFSRKSCLLFSLRLLYFA